jgi:Ca2+/Na+ antiporter
MIVRGFFIDASLLELKNNKGTQRFVKKEIEKFINLRHLMTLVFLIFTIVFYYLISKYLGIFAVIAAALFMLACFPYLIWEIKHGRKVEQENKGLIYYLNILMLFAAFPLFWVATIYLLK